MEKEISISLIINDLKISKEVSKVSERISLRIKCLKLSYNWRII